jgi:hypothetical protein
VILGIGFAARDAPADELVLPQTIERNVAITAAYRFSRPATGHGFLDIEWTDTTGRLVERRRIALELAGASEATFPLDLRRAVAIGNTLSAHLSFDQTEKGGAAAHRDQDQTATFIVPPPDHPWRDYQIVMWQPQSAAGYAGLKRLGITGGMVEADHRSRSGTYMKDMLAALVAANLRCYLENIATDFYSPYHRWAEGRAVNWRFAAAKERYRQDPHGISAFIREPSLSDPAWLDKVSLRISRDVAALRPYRPLYYSLGDETGIADLSAFWDFDFSGPSLAGFRAWLRERYGSIDVLNREWSSGYRDWTAVTPMTTVEALTRRDQNFSAWADFKEWMDVAFARAIARGTTAVHAADPQALSAIEGAQIPGWGGYDYSRLADSVDLMELYDRGDNVEIARSFNPQLILLTTSFRRGPAETHRVWRELLRGTRGLVLWDENHEFAGADGELGVRGSEAKPYFAQIRSGIGALLIGSRRHIDPIAILYSPASMRVRWLLDRRASGEDWSQRTASSEYGDDAIRRTTRDIVQAVEHLGLQPQFISTEAVERSVLRDGHYRLLMLPQTIALSSAAAAAIRDFVAQGGIAVADGEPGLFDEHGRRLGQPQLARLFDDHGDGGAALFPGRAIRLPSRSVAPHDYRAAIAKLLAVAKVSPPFPVTMPDGEPLGDVETHVFTDRGVTILALQRDPLPPDESSRIADRRRGEDAVVILPRPLNIYDMRTGWPLGKRDRVTIVLDPVEPVLLALAERPLSPPSITGPTAARRGDNVAFQVRSSATDAPDVIHLDVRDASGRIRQDYSRNLMIRDGSAEMLLPLALNDAPGTWEIGVRDGLSGATARAELTVAP